MKPHHLEQHEWDLEAIVVNQAQKGKYCMILTCGVLTQTNKHQTNETKQEDLRKVERE